MNAPSETETVIVQPAATEGPASTQTPPPAAAQGETPEAEQARERDEAGKFRKPVQPRIDEFTRAQRQAERETAYWRQRAEAAEKPPEPPKAKPTPEQFDDYGAYVEAISDWKAEEKIKTTLEARDAAAAEKQTAATRATNWSERETQTRTAVADYDEVMRAADTPIAQHVIDQLLESEEGPRIAYHLAKHPEIAAKLNTLTPIQAAREIGRLEARVAVPVDSAAAADETPPDAASTPAPATKPPKTTSAPPPAKPVASGRATTVPLEKMSMDEYVATRKAQGASWARR